MDLKRDLTGPLVSAASIMEALNPPKFRIRVGRVITIDEKEPLCGSYAIVRTIFDANKLPTLKVKEFRGRWEDGLSSILREITILRALNHPNIMKLRELVFTPPSDAKGATIHNITGEHINRSKVSMILAGGCSSLGNWFPDEIQMREPTFPEKCRTSYDGRELIPSIMYQIIRGVAHMHSQGFLHRDIKPDNIIVYSDGDIPLCQVADFGLARYGIVTDLRAEYSTVAFTLRYRPPEILAAERNQIKYDYSADVWAIGVVFAELLADEPFFNDSDEDAMFENIGELYRTKKGSLAFSPKFMGMFGRDGKRYPWVTEDALDLLQKLLQINPRDRISLADALKHPYFDTEIVRKTEEMFASPLIQPPVCDSVLLQQKPHLIEWSKNLASGYRYQYALAFSYLLNDHKESSSAIYLSSLAITIFDRYMMARPNSKNMWSAVGGCIVIAQSLLEYGISEYSKIARLIKDVSSVNIDPSTISKAIFDILITLEFKVYNSTIPMFFDVYASSLTLRHYRMMDLVAILTYCSPYLMRTYLVSDLALANVWLTEQLLHQCAGSCRLDLTNPSLVWDFVFEIRHFLKIVGTQRHMIKAYDSEYSKLERLLGIVKIYIPDQPLDCMIGPYILGERFS